MIQIKEEKSVDQLLLSKAIAMKTIGRVLFTLTFLGVVGILQSTALKNLSRNKLVSALSEKTLTLDSQQLKLARKVPTLGFRSLMSDYFFLQFLQYFGDEQSRKITGYGMSSEYLDTVLTHDPYYRYFYLFLSESTTFYAGTPDKTIRLMKEKLSYLKENRAPDSYYIWRYKGTDELLFVNKSIAAQQSFETAAAWAKASNEKNSQLMATLSQQTADFLASDPDSTQAKIGAWANILTTSRDEQTRARAVQNIHELGGDVVISNAGGISIKYPPVSEEGIRDDRNSGTY